MNSAYAIPKRSNPRALPAALAGKLVAIILALTLVMGLLLCGIDRAFAATMPRLDVKVQGEQVRLGDVFDGLSQNAEFVLAPAPGPGEELVWNAPTLLRIATAFNLPWRPETDTEIRIRRAAVLIDADTLRAIVRDHLAGLGETDSFKITFSGDVPEIIVPGETAPTLQLADFNMQEAGGTFSAIVRIGGGRAKAQTVTLRGVAERMVRVPVLKTPLKNGDIITEDKIAWTTEKATSLRKDAVRDLDTLLGSTPRRTLNAGETIRADDLEKPQLVKSGEIVTMIYNQNGMYLTVRGRALQDGALGQSVKVSNTGSNRTIEARVSNRKEVTVN